MLELSASYGSGEPVRIRRIADDHGIPPRFLVQILLQLKGAGFVMSTRGASGGYQLARDPADISLGEVMTVIEGPREGGVSTAGPPSSPAGKVLARVWHEVTEVEEKLLRDVTFANLVERAASSAEEMYYI